MNTKHYQLKLYKYKSFSEKDKQHLDDFLNQKIWLQPLNCLNDPYEGVFKLSVPSIKTINDYPDLYQIIVDSYRTNNANISESEIKESLPDFLDMLKNNRKNIFNQFGRFGVLSLSDNDKNIPMWTYYAENHSGYCAIFDVNLSYVFNKMLLPSFQREDYFHLIKSGEEAICFHTDDDEFNFMFSKINYSNTIPEVPFDQAIQLRTAKPSDQMRFMFKYAFGVKYEQWQHESEYRIIVNANSLDHAGKAIPVENHVPFIKVSGFIMGEKFEDKNLMLELCKKHELDLYQATLSDME